MITLYIYLNKIGGEKMVFINKKELAERLSISIITLDRQRKKGLPFHKLGGRIVFVYDEVAEWIVKNGQ